MRQESLRFACEAWGWAISQATTQSASNGSGALVAPDEVYDLDRLERAIAALVEENARLREQSGELRRELAQRAARVNALEGELLEANQRRQDVAKRVDELIAQMDALDAQLAAAESGQSGEEGR